MKILRFLKKIKIQRKKYFADTAKLIFKEYIQPRLLQIRCYLQPKLFTAIWLPIFIKLPQ